MNKGDLLKNAFLVLLGVLLTFLIDYQSKSEKSLSYEIISKSEIFNFKNESFSGIQVYFDTTKVRNVNSSIIKISNDGDIPISKSEFDSKLVISLNQTVKILKSNINEKNPNDLNPILSVSNNQISIEPLLLNPNDQFVLQILTEGSIDSLFVNARIFGINSIIKKEINVKDSVSFSIKIWVLIFLIVITFVYISITSTINVSPTLKNYRFIHEGELFWNQLILFIITVLLFIGFLKVVGIEKVWLQILLMIIYLVIFNEGFKYFKTKGYNRLRNLGIEEIKDDL